MGQGVINPGFALLVEPGQVSGWLEDGGEGGQSRGCAGEGVSPTLLLPSPPAEDSPLSALTTHWQNLPVPFLV